jgi:tRNA-specific 2-thiouridylase
MHKQRVLVALSGGVDSSVCALLLQQQNYDLLGLTFLVSTSDDMRISKIEKGVKDAIILADNLRIPLYIIDLRKEFEEEVIEYFLKSYSNGITPNPCVHCNHAIKWKILMHLAEEFNCDYIATGHYAKIEKQKDQFFIQLPIDQGKDQTYFLWKLDQPQLKKTLFPLGDLNKEEVKRIAYANGFERISQKQESYNICFIPGGNYRKFIESKIDLTKNEEYNGYFVDEMGESIKEFNGIWNYTIGQYVGIDSKSGESLYVLNINSENKQIAIGSKEKLLKKVAYLNPFRYEINETDMISKPLKAKYSYKSPFADCKVSIVNDFLKVEFANLVSMLAPGQSIVFYSGDLLVGGGIIQKTADN